MWSISPGFGDDVGLFDSLLVGRSEWLIGGGSMNECVTDAEIAASGKGGIVSPFADVSIVI